MNEQIEKDGFWWKRNPQASKEFHRRCSRAGSEELYRVPTMREKPPKNAKRQRNYSLI